MGLNSCLYEVEIWHERRSPKKYGFKHKIFMFYMDLDDLPELFDQTWLVTYDSYGIYNFRDKDHILSHGDTAKESVVAYVKEKGLTQPVAKVKLLTNLRTFGHVFNPVSFYFCFDAQNKPLCVVPEIGNTYRELKYFYLGPDKQVEGAFKDQQVKYYYISPFTDLDNALDFRIQIPDDKLNIAIDVLKNGEKFYYTTMKGEALKLTNENLFWQTVCFPFVTLKVIFLIHWHAAILHFVKKVPHHPKDDNMQLQRDVWHVRH